MDLKKDQSSSNKSQEEIANFKELEKNRLALKDKIIAQNRLKMREDIVSFQAGLNSLMEGENPTNILGLPNEVIIVRKNYFNMLSF